MNIWPGVHFISFEFNFSRIWRGLFFSWVCTIRGRSHIAPKNAWKTLGALLSPFFQSARAVALRRRLSLLSNHQLRSRYKKEISSHDLRCACGILKSWVVFISMRRGRAWKKRTRRTATASLPLWARIPRVYIWNNELKRAKDAICERPLKTPVLSVCIVLVIFSASFFFCPLFAAVFPRSDFFLLSNECVLKCSEVQYFPQNILK